MSKTSSVYRNLKRVKMAEKYANRRQKQKAIAMDKSVLLKRECRLNLLCKSFLRILQDAVLEIVAKLQDVHVVITENLA